MAVAKNYRSSPCGVSVSAKRILFYSLSPGTTRPFRVLGGSGMVLASSPSPSSILPPGISMLPTSFAPATCIHIPDSLSALSFVRLRKTTISRIQTVKSHQKLVRAVARQSKLCLHCFSMRNTNVVTMVQPSPPFPPPSPILHHPAALLDFGHKPRSSSTFGNISNRPYPKIRTLRKVPITAGRRAENFLFEKKEKIFHYFLLLSYRENFFFVRTKKSGSLQV